MTSPTIDPSEPKTALTRRTALIGAAAGVIATAPLSRAIAQFNQPSKDITMQPKAFVYTELQLSVVFDEAPWRKLSETISTQPGFLNKTWLSGIGNNSLGGFYAFDSIDNAQRFVTVYFPTEPRAFGAAHNTRIFDADVVTEASLDIGSPHFGRPPTQEPGAFVYTEVQVNLPFDEAPWRERNPVLKQTPGLISKTWLSGLHTNTIGGIDAFDTLDNARRFAVDAFPETAAKMNAAFYTRIFDATLTAEASRFLKSPYYL